MYKSIYLNTKKTISPINQVDLSSLSDEALDTMRSIFFTADYHHGHTAIIRHADRPSFKNIEDHNEWIIEEVHNKHVNKNDRIYMLGDISMAHKKQARLFLDKLKGKKFLVLGNHDKSIQRLPQFVKIDKMMDFRFKEFSLNINISLCHYPMITWDKSFEGSWSLYGHVHGRLKHPHLGLDVGIDNDDVEKYRPINLIEIIEWMHNKMKIIGDNNLNN